MKRTLNLLAALLMALSLLAPAPRPVRADVAPPETPAGSTLLPGSETTQVRMLAETVMLDVSVDPADAQRAVARTTAQFTMRNLGAEAEQLQVRFPLRFTMWPDQRFQEITDLQVRVDGRRVSTQKADLIYTEVRNDWTQELELPWSVFEVTFQPSQDVNIEVTYTAHGFGYYPYQVFRYILQTGAGWKDTIGSADIIVRLPYEVNKYNLWESAETGFSSTTPGGQFNGKEAKWHYENFEPTFQNDFEVSLITLTLWQKVLTEKANLSRNPNDGEAWGRLAKAYKEMSRAAKGYPRTDAVGKELFSLSAEAYEKCLSLLPKDSLWHTGYADLLWTDYYFNIHFSGQPDPDGRLTRALEHLQTALDLDPNNQMARDLLDSISYSIPEAVEKTETGYDLLALTATPIPPTPFAMDTETPVSAGPTQAATVTAQPPTFSPATSTLPSMETPAKGNPLPVCGGAALLLPLAGTAFWLTRRRGVR